MYRLFMVLMLVCTGTACKKENSDLPGANKISSIHVVCDDEDISRQYSANQPNDFSQYLFIGFAGNYFGYISTFQIDDKQTIQIRFGTLLSQHSKLTRKESLTLIGPGSRAFGSLGAYSSYPLTVPNCAEIAFTDKSSTRWSSTKIMENKTRYGIEATVNVHQPAGEFIIDSVRDEMLHDSIQGFQVKGHFDCLIYEVNGGRTKRMSGDFLGIVSGSN